jgi:hypothetical protein
MKTDAHDTPDTLTAFDPGEKPILTIKRHAAGLIGVYLVCGLIAMATIVLAFGIGSNIAADGGGQAYGMSALVSLFVSALCALVAVVVTGVYRANKWILTADSLTQVEQSGLFKRESSQLALEHIEDVTSEQIGMMARMFNYGVLKVAIPGESDKYVFPFCPNPNYYAARILRAREDFQEYAHEKKNASPKKSQPEDESEIASYDVPDGTD